MIPMKKNSLSILSVRNVTEYPRLSDKPSVFHYTQINLNKIVQKIDQTSEDSQKNIHNFLKKIADDNDPINFAKSVFPESKQYLFEILTEVIDEFHQEEQLSDISAESLKGMLLFFVIH